MVDDVVVQANKTLKHILDLICLTVIQTASSTYRQYQRNNCLFKINVCIVVILCCFPSGKVGIWIKVIQSSFALKSQQN